MQVANPNSNKVILDTINQIACKMSEEKPQMSKCVYIIALMKIILDEGDCIMLNDRLKNVVEKKLGEIESMVITDHKHATEISELCRQVRSKYYATQEDTNRKFDEWVDILMREISSRSKSAGQN